MTGKRKIRPATFDPNAVDADGDGIVQEGTTAEHPVSLRAPKKVAKRVVIEHDQIQPERGPIRAKMRSRISTVPDVTAKSSTQRLLKRAEEKYGSFSTKESAEKALKRAFPNAEIDLSGTKEMMDNLGTKNDEWPVAVQSFVGGILSIASLNSKTANQVSMIRYTSRDEDYQAQAGLTMLKPTQSNLFLSFSDEISLSADQSFKITDQLNEELFTASSNPVIGKSGSSGAYILSGSDEKVYGMYIALHEWRHLSDMTKSMHENAPIASGLQQWVTSGDDADIPDEVANIIESAREGVDAFFESKGARAAAAEEISARVKKIYKKLGFNVKSTQSEEAARRAVVARQAYAIHVVSEMDRWYASQLNTKDWKKFGKIGQYALSDRAEAVAEGFAFRQLVGDAFEIEVPDSIQKRLNTP